MCYLKATQKTFKQQAPTLYEKDFKEKRGNQENPVSAECLARCLRHSLIGPSKLQHLQRQTRSPEKKCLWICCRASRILTSPESSPSLAGPQRQLDSHHSVERSQLQIRSCLCGRLLRRRLLNAIPAQSRAETYKQHIMTDQLAGQGCYK